MNNMPLHQFVEKTMAIGGNRTGAISVTGGILGAMSMNRQIIQTLRENTMRFAIECAKLGHGPRPQNLSELARKLEESLYAAQLVDAVTEDTLQSLIADMQALIA